MKKKHLILPIILFISTFYYLSADAPDTLWTKTYGSSDWDSRGKIVRQTNDGGFIIGGETKLTMIPDFYLVRTNSEGDTLWTKTYGGEDNDKCNAIHVTDDNGFFVVGCTYRSSTKWDIYLLRLDPNGDTLWTKTYGGYDDEDAISIMPANDGYIIAGKTRPSQTEDFDIYIVTIDTAGEVLSTKTYGGDYDDVAESAEKTNDGGCIITGTSFSPDLLKRELFLVRTDHNADTLWAKSYIEGVYNLGGKSVKQLSDGGFIITGSLDSDTTDVFDMDIYVLRTDPAGEIVWSKTYPITVGDGEDVGNSISVIGESGYIIAGHRHIGQNQRDLYIMRTNLTGDTLWTRTYGKRNLESAKCIEPVSDGGFIIAGYTTLIGDQYSKIYLLRLDKEATGIQEENPKTFLNLKNFIVSSYQGNISIRYTLPYSTRIKLEAFDIQGRLVEVIEDRFMQKGSYRVNWDSRRLASGVYYIKLTSGNSTLIKKAVLFR